MDRQGIKRGQLAKLIDVRFEVADKWYRGEVEKMQAVNIGSISVDFGS